MAGNVITIADIRAAGHCPRGVKDWCEQHDIDFRALCRDGIEEAVFLADGDALSQAVVDHRDARLNADG